MNVTDADDLLRVLNVLERCELSPNDLNVAEDALIDEFGARVIVADPESKTIQFPSGTRARVYKVGSEWIWFTTDMWKDLNEGKGPKELQEEYDAMTRH